MKHSLKSFTPFTRGLFKNFSTTKPADSSISLRFHELYVKELERIQKTSYAYF